MLRLRGDYSRAQNEIEIAVRLRPWALHYQSLRRRILGELKVLRHNYRPNLVGRAPFTPTPNHILHLLEFSLPHSTNGYSYRTDYVLRIQQEFGLAPVAVTRPGFPRNYGSKKRFGWFKARGPDNVNHVRYYRLPAQYSFTGTLEPLDSYLQHYAERALDVAIHVRPQLIHAASDFKNGIVAWSLAQTLAVPWIYEFRGVWEDTRVANGIVVEGSEGHRYMKNQETWCLENADAVVTLSQRMKEEIVSREVDPEKVFVIPNGVDTKRFSPQPKDETLKTKLKLSDGPVIGYIGSLTRYEGLDLLLRSFSLLSTSQPDARLVIVGDGDMDVTLKQLVVELGLENAVLLIGSVDHREVSRYYSLIDIFVVPRLSVPVCEVVTPIKPYEAMSSGCAVLLSDVGGLSELVREGAPVLSFKAGSFEDLAARCRELIKNPHMRLELGASAVKWVRSNATWHSNVQLYRQAYASTKHQSF